MLDHGRMLRRQKVLADFGEFTLVCDDLDQVLTAACRLVAAALDTSRAKVLEIQPGGQGLLVRAGVGWAPDVVGRLILPMEEHSSETYSIRVGRPVITRDIEEESRFEVPAFMRDAGVTAFVNVPIRLPGGKAYGLLQVDDTARHDFGEEDAEFLRTYTTILGPVIDRLLKLRDLRASEERFRLTVEEARDYAILVTEPQGRITDWLPGAAAVLGWSAEEAVGQPCSMLFTPEDRERGEHAEELRLAGETGFSPNIREHLRKDGSRVFIEGSVRALHDAAGTLTGFLKIGRDVTERRAAETRLRESEARLRTLMEGVPQLFWRSADEGRWTWASPQWLDYTGQTQEESRDRGWLSAVHPGDRDAAMRAWHEAFLGGRLNVEYRVRNAADGTWRWHQTRSVPVRAGSTPAQPDGHIVEWLGTTTDIEELKRLQDAQGVLVAELQHRTRNLLAVVRTLSRKSVPPSPGRDEYDARLGALGRVQGFLAQRGTYAASLRDIVEEELRATGSEASARVTVDGPSIELPGGGMQPVALALHELATNAVKYGALAETNPEGRLSVTWHVEMRGAGASLLLFWHESGVAMRAGPPDRRGYGSELITRALPYQLKAETRLEFTSDGVRCRMALPAGTFRAMEREAP